MISASTFSVAPFWRTHDEQIARQRPLAMHDRCWTPGHDKAAIGTLGERRDGALDLSGMIVFRAGFAGVARCRTWSTCDRG